MPQADITIVAGAAPATEKEVCNPLGFKSPGEREARYMACLPECGKNLDETVVACCDELLDVARWAFL